MTIILPDGRPARPTKNPLPPPDLFADLLGSTATGVGVALSLDPEELPEDALTDLAVSIWDDAAANGFSIAVMVEKVTKAFLLEADLEMAVAMIVASQAVTDEEGDENR